MTDYKRLTDNTKSEALVDCHDCPYCGVEYLYDCHIKVCNRLAELEDKIENGTLKELPEDAVVIPEKITEETSPKDIIKIAKYNEKVRKETAREIFEKLFPDRNIFNDNDAILIWQVKDLLKKLAKLYDVEVEE